MKQQFFNILILISSISSYSQNSSSESDDKFREFYTSIYKSSDSIKVSGNVGKIDARTYKIADSLDALYPSSYYEKAMNYMTKSKFNEASFLYLVGVYRFKYFNSANPNYKPSGDGALNASLNYMIGEPIGIYLKSNFENYISILKSCQKYFAENDYKFYSKSNNVDKFDMQINNFSKQISDLENNKQKYIKEWKKERKETEDLLKE